MSECIDCIHVKRGENVLKIKKNDRHFFFFFENPEHSQCIMPCKSNGIFVSEIMCTAEEQKVDTVTFDAKIVLPNGVKKTPPLSLMIII